MSIWDPFPQISSPQSSSLAVRLQLLQRPWRLTALGKRPVNFQAIPTENGPSAS